MTSSKSKKKIKNRTEFEEQSQLFDDILQTMIVGVAKVDMNGIITFANDAALNYLEDPKMVGRFHMSGEIDQIDDAGDLIELDTMPLARTLNTGEVVRNFHHGLVIKDKLKWFSVNSAPLMKDGIQVGAIANFVDITKQIESTKSLQQNEEKFKALAENLPGFIYTAVNDDIRRITYVNEEAERLTGYSKKDFLEGNVTIYSLVHPDDLKVNHSKQDDAIKKGRSFTLEYRLQKKSGDWIWVKDTAVGVTTNDGVLKFVEGYIEDITETKKANEETRLNEQRFRILFNDSGHSIGITDSKGIFLDANKKFLDLTEYSLEELCGKKNFLDLTHPDDLEIGQAQLKRLLNGEIPHYQVEKRYVSKSNKVIYFRVNISCFKDPVTGELNIVGTADDITESKQTEEKVKLNERKFHSLFENAANAILITNMAGLVVEMNKQAEQLLGYAKKDVEGQLSIKMITHADDLSPNDEILKKLSKAKSNSIITENRYYSKSKEIYWVQENISSYMDETSGETMVVRIIEDISERRTFIKEIQASELRFRSIFEEAGHGVVIANKKGYLTKFNKKFRKILGLSKKDMESKLQLLDFVHPDFIEEAKSQFEILRNDPKATIQLEIKILTKKRKTIWVRLNGATYQDPITLETRMVGILENTTEIKDALDNLESSEVFLHETINALSIALMVMKTDGNIEKTNLVWDQLTSSMKALSKAKRNGNFLKSIENLSVGSKVSDGLSEILDGSSEHFEIELPLDSKEHNWFALRASKLKPEFDSLVITLQDVTIRKHVEQALEESLEKYRHIISMTPVMMHSIDKDGNLLSVSDFWLEKLGYQRHEAIGKNLRDFLTEDSRKDAEVILPVFFQKGSIFDVSYSFITKNGEILETLLSAIEEGEGSNARSFAVVTDITPLRIAERQLKKNRKDLEEAQILAKLGHYELDIENGTFITSEVFDEILEISDETEKHFNLLQDICPKEDRDYLDNLFGKVLKEGGSFEYVGRAITLKSEKELWLDGLGNVFMKDGRPVKLKGTIQDITKSKTAELEIQKLSERLSLATKSAGIGVWEEDLINREHILDNETQKIFTGVKSTVKNGIMDINITHTDDIHLILDAIARLNKGEELVDYSRRIVAGNETKHVQVIIHQIFNEDGQPIRRVGTARDVTKDHLLLEQLEKSLSEKDILIKEVHHRVKNNMQMISSILSLKSLELKDNDSKIVFNDCTSRIKSMALVHDQLYRFYDVTEIDMSEYLNYLLSGLHSLMGGSSGNYIVDVKAESYLLNVDQALLCGLIVSEIVANAFKHGFKEKQEGAINVIFKVKKKNKSLIITNTGSEIPNDILEIRTSSLGMSLIKTFVKQLNGFLKLHPDNGFQVDF